jgi:short-subunit dehydrogenase
MLLVSSLAAACPAPTRALYCSTKAASLLLYQSLAIEHPSISFSFVLPSTVEGDFRASAVDGGEVRQADPKKHGLKQDAVARRCIEAVDESEKTVFMPPRMKIAAFLYLFWPTYVEAQARKLYNF